MRKWTPMEIFEFLYIIAFCLFCLIILIDSHENKEKVSDTTPTTEPKIVMATKASMDIPEALKAMPKPDPKPIYTRINLTPVEMLFQTSAKTYMDYRSITNRSSNQYRLIHSDEIEICEDGFLRDKDGYIGVALGSRFGEIGSRYICHMDNGKDIKVIKVEAKANIHAVNGFCGSANYDIVEFVIDSRADWMRKNVWGNGYIFSGNFNNYEEFNGIIVSIDKVD